jgi:hypothetical protein
MWNVEYDAMRRNTHLPALFGNKGLKRREEFVYLHNNRVKRGAGPSEGARQRDCMEPTEAKRGMKEHGPPCLLVLSLAAACKLVDWSGSVT